MRRRLVCACIWLSRLAARERRHLVLEPLERRRPLRVHEFPPARRDLAELDVRRAELHEQVGDAPRRAAADARRGVALCACLLYTSPSPRAS